SLCLGKRHAFFQTTHWSEEVSPALFHTRSIEVHWNPELCCSWEGELPGHHTQHQMRSPIKRDRFVDDVWIATKATLPQSVTQYCDLIIAGLFIVENERTTK